MKIPRQASVQSRKRRGMATQSAVAGWFAGHGWPHAESQGAGRAGDDVTGMGAVHVEVKARRGINFAEWLRQANARGGDGGPCIVVFRPDGAGPGTIGQWGVLMDLETVTRLLRDGGYAEDVH